MFVLLQQAPGGELPGGYGVMLLQTLLALVAVCVLAWVVLKWAAQRGFGGAGVGGRIRVLERVSLDPRRALYVVKVGGKLLLLGAGDTGAPALLTELDADAAAETPAAPGIAFSDVLAKLRGKDAKPASKADPGAES